MMASLSERRWGKSAPGLTRVEGAHQRRQLALVAIDGGVVDEAGRQAERQRRLAPDDLRHRIELGVGGDARDIGHHHPAHRRMAEIDPHVGDRAAAMPGEELGDRAPRPFAVDRAVERLELRGVLRALRRGDGRRRQAVDAADAFRHAAENGEFAGAGKAARRRAPCRRARRDCGCRRNPARARGRARRRPGRRSPPARRSPRRARR